MSYVVRQKRIQVTTLTPTFPAMTAPLLILMECFLLMWHQLTLHTAPLISYGLQIPCAMEEKEIPSLQLTMQRLDLYL